MTVQKVFARREIKYILTKAQRARLEDAMAAYMIPDDFGRSVICSLYYDTPDHRLIRRSLDSPVYKEKLRLRSYGPADSESVVYAEIKKKYDSVVYKRRVGLRLDKAVSYLGGGWREGLPAHDQISRELHFMLERYENLRESAYISCEREAFYAKDDHEFRITFDDNIFGRNWDLSLNSGTDGIPLIDSHQCLMELKVGGSLPLWMCAILSRERIHPTPFSKYGTLYRDLILPKYEIKTFNGGENHVARTVQWIV